MEIDRNRLSRGRASAPPDGDPRDRPFRGDFNACTGHPVPGVADRWTAEDRRSRDSPCAPTTEVASSANSNASRGIFVRQGPGGKFSVGAFFTHIRNRSWGRWEFTAIRTRDFSSLRGHTAFRYQDYPGEQRRGIHSHREWRKSICRVFDSIGPRYAKADEDVFELVRILEHIIIGISPDEQGYDVLSVIGHAFTTRHALRGCGGYCLSFRILPHLVKDRPPPEDGSEPAPFDRFYQGTSWSVLRADPPIGCHHYLRRINRQPPIQSNVRDSIVRQTGSGPWSAGNSRTPDRLDSDGHRRDSLCAPACQAWLFAASNVSDWIQASSSSFS